MATKDTISKTLDEILMDLDSLRGYEDLSEDEYILVGKAFDYVESAYDNLLDVKDNIRESIKLLEKLEKSLKGE